MSASNDGESAADRALRNLSTSLVPVEDPARAAERRARLVTGLDEFAAGVFATRSTGRSFRRYVALASVIVAAALVLVAGHVWRTHGTDATRVAPTLRAKDGNVRIERNGSASGTVERLPFELGAQDRVKTEDGQAEVSLVSGAVVQVGPNSELGLGAADRTSGTLDERIALASGKIRLRVPKLAVGSRLRIGTPNATVTVHGTVFTVEVRPQSAGVAAITTVSVTEGRVSVASNGREIFLDPGVSWSSASDASPPASSTAATEANTTLPDVRNPAGVKRSTLGDENDLFRAAIAARRAGNPKRAVELIDRLLSKYPTSPLSSEVRAERAAALVEVGAAEAPSALP